ncbi:PREDICTED: uncharacterized protein LOC109175034 [Ipomoea nil]|uniref:uncharacterized protein LOC109175034 n=1 Tax=Ipomoea nil TaxID=35883 RepID=UPI0009020172|nr:PREDICTED: uncharacterized protein LOC109175034 [Ipomoea nil]
MVSTWIMRSISPEIAQTVFWVGTAEKIWTTLKSRFSEADIFRISDLHAEIHQIRQGDLTVSAYFAKLKSLWDELQVIRPLPTCKCERMCNCVLLDTLQQHLESDNLSVFLRGLNETYASVQSQIMMTKPLPTVDEAFMMIQQQERRFNCGTADLQIQEARQHSPYSREWFSQDEFRMLRQLLQRDCKVQSSSPLSGSEGIAPQTNLIAANLLPIYRWKVVEGMFVELPNGDKIKITHVGSICADSLVLENVFCVPGFHYNLISISELIRASKCKLLLYDDLCVIQDQGCGRMIGLARLQRGLYHLVKPDFSVFN